MTDITPEDIDKARRFTRSLGTLNGRVVYSEDYVDELAALATKYLKRCQELEADAAEHAVIIDLQHKRMVEASRLWQQAHGYDQDSIWPDLGELLAWLMQSVEREATEKRRAINIALLIERNVNQARRWSAAWKRAAKFYRVYYHTAKLYKFTRWNARGEPESRLTEREP